MGTPANLRRHAHVDSAVAYLCHLAQQRVRQQGLIGAGAESAAGSTDLSPNQVALLRSRRPA